MRSKKIRIAITGSFLGLLAVVLVIRKESTALPRSLDLASSQISATHSRSNATPSSVGKAESSAPASAAALWSYINKPASAARVESLMVTPSHDVHYAQIDQTLLSSDQSPLKQKGARVNVALPDGTVLPIIVEKTRSIGPDRYVTEGSMEGQNQGRAVFAYNHGEMSAVIDDAQHGSWQMRSVGTATSQVFKVDGTMVPSCEASVQKMAAMKAATTTANATGTASPVGGAPVAAGDDSSGDWTEVQDPQQVTSNSWGNTEIRILVPYSKVIESVLSQWSIQSYIDLVIGQLNNDLARSAIPVTVTLAGAPGLQYDQEWDGSWGPALTALNRITNSADGIMDEVHVMRVDANADLVCFAMCAIDNGYSGVGYILNAPGDVFNATNGFSVVNFWYMSSNSVFSHEIGHNLGCNHDRQNAYAVDGSSPAGVYDYSYGYRFYGNDGQMYRTIMAYPPGNVLPYFSNPNLWAWWPINAPVGMQLGQWDEAYNALTITQNATEVSAYRYSRLVLRIARRIRGW